MAWGRLALIQAAGENDVALQKTAEVFGFNYVPEVLQAESTSADENKGKDDEGKQELSSNKEISKRPPVRFLRVNKIQRLENPDGSKPNYLNDPSMRLKARPAPTNSYSFASPRPLLPMSRLLPFLHNGLGQSRAVGKVDYRCLTKHLAEAKALRRLPYLSRQRWPQRLQIVVDPSSCLEPYWADFAFIIERLKKLLGVEAVTAIRFDEDSLGEELTYCIPWPTQDSHAWFQWQMPSADEAILILSDLGMTEAHPAARIRWQRLLKRLQAHPAPMLTLSPVSQSPRNRELCRQVRPNPLNDGYNLPRHPNRKGFALTESAAEKIDDILALLSPLPVVDAGLLRRFRDELQWGGSELESQIWNHADIRQTSLGIRLQEIVAENYRKRYQQKFAGTSQAERLWQIVLDHHAQAFEGLRQLEVLNRCVVEGHDSTEVRDYLKRLCATVAQESSGSVRRSALLRQCRTILASRPESIWQSDLGDIAYDLYGMTYADEIRIGKWPDKLETGFDPNRLQWLLDARARVERVHWQIVQTGGQGQFSLRRADSSADENLPIVTFGPIAVVETQPAFPPSWHFSTADDDVWAVVHDGQAFTLNSGVMTIRTALQRLELEVISKPAWATSIWRNADGLFAGIPWLGAVHPVLWQVAEAEYASHWVWPQPFGEDQYGLYADLNVKNITQRFRWISPGSFQMGTPKNELTLSSYIDESEVQHLVVLSQGYWLADTACTQALWQVVMGDNPARFKDNPDNPVETVSWEDVQQFIATLNELVPGLDARLPTEAQWEYACRAGTSTAFSFGENITPEQVNYDGYYPYNDGAKGLNRQQTVPAGSLPSNPWGLYEMHGNVWEWCSDWYGDYPSESATDPIGPPEGADRVLRGGSWYFKGGHARSTFRNWNSPVNRSDFIGFRLSLGQTAFTRQEKRAEQGHYQQNREKIFLSQLWDRIKSK